MAPSNIKSPEYHYTNAVIKKIEVLPNSGYVSSSYDYFVDVSITRNNKRQIKTFCLTGGFFTGKRKAIDNSAPKYLIVDTKRKIKAAIDTGIIKWREYDHSGAERLENLKYYDKELLRNLIAAW